MPSRPDPEITRNAAPPSGTVCFLFTDIEGSTIRWELQGDGMGEAVRLHDGILRASIESQSGHVFKTMGDAFYAAFHSVAAAVRAAYRAQIALAAEDFSGVSGLRVRMGVHADTVESRDGDYFGPALNMLARLLQTAHGEQIVLSASAAALLTNALDAEFSLLHLGEHRLKDLQSPEHVYQLRAPGLREAFPPLRSLSVPTHNLPPNFTSFVGREDEADALYRQITQARLLSLVGAGGVGKTRLALHVASRVLDVFTGGVWFIDLAPLVSSDLVASEGATALGLTLGAGEGALQAVVTHLRARKALLIFDNCEHVLSETANVVKTILERCPEVNVIVTSRQPLGIRGEVIHAVATLDEPSSLELFADRARAQRETFALDTESTPIVANICRRLDGIPLAIELAAARIGMLSPSALLDRLNERFRLLTSAPGSALPRQQTLRSLIDWSYNLLDARERRTFECLAVFSGGWTLEAATAVCAADAYDDWDVLELLSSLVSKSLVVAELDGGNQRYHFLDSIHEYASGLLAAGPERETVRRKHAQYIAAYLEQRYGIAEVDGDDAGWKAAVVPEVDNLRGATAWAMKHDPELALRILAALPRPNLIVQIPEALALYETAATLVSEATPRLTASRVLRRFVRLQLRGGEPVARQEVSTQRAVDVARASGDPDEIAHALTERAMLQQHAGRFEEADATFAQARTAAQNAPARTLRSVIFAWGINDLERGEAERARERFAQTIELETPGSESLAFAYMNLAEAEFALGNARRANDAARRAKQELLALGHGAIVNVNCNLAAYALAQGDTVAARACLFEALADVRAGAARAPTIVTLEHHALLAALEGDHAVAATLAGYTDADYAANGSVRQRTESSSFAQLTALLRAHVAEPRLTALLEAGAASRRAEALSLAESMHATSGKPSTAEVSEET